jgi:GntR family transcriptional regulator
LPPERALAEELGTSRTTLRKALAELAAEGRLRRTQGSGNYVAPPKIVPVRQLTSLTEDLASMGLSASARILELERVSAGDALAAIFGISATETLWRLTRLRLVDGEPLALEVAHLPGTLPDFAHQLVEHGSLYTTLREAYGRRIATVEDAVEVALVDPREADFLDVGVGQPGLLIHRTGRDESGAVVEWTRSLYRGDRFRFVAAATVQA